MASTSSFPPLVSRKTPVPIVLAGSIVTLGPHWRNCISSYVDPLVKRLSEENYSNPLARMNFVAYSQVHPALIDPVYSVVGHDEEENIITDDVIIKDSPDNAAFWGYMSVIKIIDDFKTTYPNKEFSFFLWHVVAGQHGSWDHKWEIVCGELMKHDVNLSMVFLDDCPIFAQLFSAISPESSRIKPWFHTFPDHRFLLSGFIPPGELDVPSAVSAAHPAPSISIPSTTGVWDHPSDLPVHGARYPDDQWMAPPFLPHAESDVYLQGPTLVPFLNPYESPQASSSALETTDSCDNFINANTNAHARPMASEPSDKINNNDWTGTLNLNGTRVPVRALMAEAVGDPKLSALSKNDLELELAAGLELSTLAIQVWIRKNKAPMVRLSYVDGTDNGDFSQLVEKIRANGYAVVTWEKRDRLLLAPLGKVLLCATFPEKGTPKRPTPQPPRKVRTVTRKENSQKKKSSQKREKGTSRKRPSPYPATRSKSPNGPCDGLYSPEVATLSTMTLQPEQPEQPPTSYYPQVLMECTQGEINPSSQWHRMDGVTQRQMISPPQPLFHILEPHAYLQAPRGMLGAQGEQVVHCGMDTGAAGCMVDPYDLKSEAVEVPDIYEYVNL